MHPLFANADRRSGEVIGVAIEVHRIIGSGLLESIYFHELNLIDGIARRLLPATKNS
jgi:hypothetical protein